MGYRVGRTHGGSTAPRSLRENVLTGRTHIQETLTLCSNHPVAVDRTLMTTVLTEQHGLSSRLIHTNGDGRSGASHCYVVARAYR